MIIGRPIVPLERYYVRHIGLTGGDLINTTQASYQVAGAARPHRGEILRTNAFCWLTPLIAILPLIALRTRANDLPIWITFTSAAVWPITVIVLASIVLSHYRKHWAPLRATMPRS